MPDLSQRGVTRFGTPFRLGSTSYVYPADILPNVERLTAQGDVDDVELILFEIDDGPNNLPDEAVVKRLADLATSCALTYTVHLPLDLRLAANGSAQHESLVKAERVIKATLPLEPFAYVFHLDGQGVMEPGWTAQALRALDAAIGWIGQSERLAVENLESWDAGYLDPILDRLPISRTVDIGHFWKMRRDPLSVLDAWLPRARVIHIHGVAERDHKSLACMPPAVIDPVTARLMDFRGVITLEVFETADFFDSRTALLESVSRVKHG
jgi:adenosylcobalamin phosphodiesterase